MSTPTYFTDIAIHFTNVIKKSTEYKTDTLSMVRNPALLEPIFGRKIDTLCENVLNKGVKVKRMETFRSNANQLAAYNRGASKVKAYGMHHFGIAQDILCLDSKGKIIDNGSAKEYSLLRAEALKLELFLLPLWDAGHMQGIAVDQQNAMRNFVLNYKTSDVPILAYGMENHYVMNLKIAMAKLGYRVNQDDMFFGEQTDESLRMFQSDNKLKVDGVAGNQVYTKMKALGYDLLTM